MNKLLPKFLGLMLALCLSQAAQALPSCWIARNPNDTAWHNLPGNDDLSTGQIFLPFTFNLYGSNYTSVWVNNNGNLTFTGPTGQFSASGFPFNVPMVAAFWGDVDTRTCGQVWYKVFSDYMVVTYEQVGYFSVQCNLRNTFEIVISSSTSTAIPGGNNVAFYYDDMAWTTGSASGGSGGFGGTPATVGINKGDNIAYVQVGRFNVNSSVYDGGGGNNDGVHYLDQQCFRFNVTNSGNQPPSFVGLPPNNRIDLVLSCGQSANLTLNAIGPEVGDSVYSSISSTVPCSYSGTTTNGFVSTSTINITAAACNVGVHTITVTATDNGVPARTTVATINVTISATDTSAPVPNVNPLPLLSANCGQSITASPPTATDNCAGSITASTLDSLTYTTPGTRVIHWTYNDGNGNISTQNQTVVIGDTVGPLISGCPGNITMNGCSQIVTWTPPTATDPCGAVAVSTTHNPGATFPAGTTTVTYTFTDLNNNVSTCSFTVTLTSVGPDTTKPVITGCPATVVAQTGPGDTTCSQRAFWTPPTATDNCGPVFDSSTHQPGDVFPLGSTLVVYTFRDGSNNSRQCWFYVTVLDKTAPAISGCPGNMTVFTGPGNTTCRARGMWTPPTAVDNCSTINTSSNYSPTAWLLAGTTTVTYTFKDASNNASTCSFNVTVVDNTPPVALCKPYTLNLSGGTGTVTAANINNGSVDNCGIASMTVSPNTFTCAQAGTVQPVVLTVTDIYGNVATCTSMVTVRYKPTCSLTVTPSNSTYTGGVATNIYLGYGPQSATITTSASGGSGLTYSWSPSANLSCSNCFNPVFTPTAPGIYTYTVTVTNSNGCSTTCTVTFCVKDVRVPNSTNVYLCHDGSPSTTMSVTPAQAASHLSSHPADRLGMCDQVCAPGARIVNNNSGNIIGQEVKVYPNPNKGSFVIDMPSFEDQAQITVTDVQGKVIARKTVTEDQSNRIDMNLGDVAKGMYFVEVVYSDQHFRTKLIIE